MIKELYDHAQHGHSPAERYVLRRNIDDFMLENANHVISSVELALDVNIHWVMYREFRARYDRISSKK